MPKDKINRQNKPKSEATTRPECRSSNAQSGEAGAQEMLQQANNANVASHPHDRISPMLAGKRTRRFKPKTKAAARQQSQTKQKRPTAETPIETPSEYRGDGTQQEPSATDTAPAPRVPERSKQPTKGMPIETPSEHRRDDTQQKPTDTAPVRRSTPKRKRPTEGTPIEIPSGYRVDDVQEEPEPTATEDVAIALPAIQFPPITLKDIKLAIKNYEEEKRAEEVETRRQKSRRM